jgi:hypothetical protein
MNRASRAGSCTPAPATLPNAPLPRRLLHFCDCQSPSGLRYPLPNLIFGSSVPSSVRLPPLADGRPCPTRGLPALPRLGPETSCGRRRCRLPPPSTEQPSPLSRIGGPRGPSSRCMLSSTRPLDVFAGWFPPRADYPSWLW